MKNKQDQKIITEVAKKNSLFLDNKITEFSSGQINNVYNLNNKYVIKIEGGMSYAKGIFEHQEKITRQLIKSGSKLPKIIDTGRIENKGYLLMEKLVGNNLVYDWPKLPEIEKERLISQLAEQLKIFHSLEYNEYNIEIYLGNNYPELEKTVHKAIGFERIDKNKLKTEHLKNLEMMEKFYQENKKVIKGEKGSAVFVHNDIHFENIFYQNNKIIGIIDFDWACQTPQDYELRNIADFFLFPFKYVEKKLEPKYQKSLNKEMGYLKKYYPELFQIKNLATRIKIFYIIIFVRFIVDCQHGRWHDNQGFLDKVNKDIEKIYKSNILEKIIDIS